MSLNAVRNDKVGRRPILPAQPPRSISRRQFVRGMAGAALLGATLGPGLLRPRLAHASGSSDPLPVVGGWSVLNPGAPPYRYHVYAPFFDGTLDSDPVTITNFDGFAGLGYISGSVSRTNTKTGEVRTLPFVDCDMRFMKGVYRGQDGHVHQGAFGFVWVDVFEPGPGDQIHDLNPTPVPFTDTTLFWTLAVPIDSIDVNLGKGSAVMEGTNIPIFDYGTGFNQLFGGGTGVPGHVSYKVKWSGVDQRANVKQLDTAFGPHAGEFVRGKAQMEWTATVGDYTFVSAPLSSSTSSFAEIGHDRNGSFFPGT